MHLLNRNGHKVTVEEDGRGGKVFRIDRGDTLDAVVVPGTIGLKVGVDVPGSDADYALLEEIAHAVPTTHANLRTLTLGTDYGDAAGTWLRLDDVIAVLQQEALLHEQHQHVLLELARAILRAVGKDQ